MPFVNEHYDLTNMLGEGTFGSVYAATEKEGEQRLVAIKVFKEPYKSWNECVQLPEVRSLIKLNPPGKKPHPNIVGLVEVFRDPKNRLHMVFEHMQSDVLQLIEAQKGVVLPEATVQLITWQLINGLAYMHSKGFFHRDLKPENLLCNGPELVKIADFGQAREIRARPPFTDYVSTRWYRAPEVSLAILNYNSMIDSWGVGCVVSELLTLTPLFPGTSTIDQMHKIGACIGPLTEASWADGAASASKQHLKLKCEPGPSLSARHPGASKEAKQLLSDTLIWDPMKRARMSTMLKKQPFLDRNNSSLSSLVGLAGLAARSSTVVHTDSNTSFLDDKPKTPDNEPISEADLSPRYGPRESELHASRNVATPAASKPDHQLADFEAELDALENELGLGGPVRSPKRQINSRAPGGRRSSSDDKETIEGSIVNGSDAGDAALEREIFGSPTNDSPPPPPEEDGVIDLDCSDEPEPKPEEKPIEEESKKKPKEEKPSKACVLL